MKNFRLEITKEIVEKIKNSNLNERKIYEELSELRKNKKTKSTIEKSKMNEEFLFKLMKEYEEKNGKELINEKQLKYLKFDTNQSINLLIVEIISLLSK